MSTFTFADDFTYDDSAKRLATDKLSLTAADGTAPMTVTSTAKVDNLNADRLDGLDSTAFLRVSNNLSDVTASTARTNLGLGAVALLSQVSNSDLSDMPTKTYKGRTSALTGDAEDVPVATLKTDLGLVKADLGLSNVDNTSDSSKPISTLTQAALDLKAPLASPTFTGTVSGVTKTMVGLGNADNTSDANKPISSATQSALDNKQPLDAALMALSAGSDFVQFSGPDSTIKTFSLPDASSTILVNGGDLGTPASGVATNLTGTASGLTAGSVTTNANLTGVVTSTGNATAIADAALSIGKTSGLQAALDLKAPLASPTFTGTVIVPTPSVSSGAATKGYVDAIKQALDIKDSVRVASTVNINVATALVNASTIDGVVVATSDRVLLKNQSSASENGIYVVAASGAALRATDADNSSKVTTGMYVFVSQGTASSGTGFVLTTADPIVLGTTNLSFTAFSGAGQVIAGNGLSESGNILSINTAVTADISTSQTFTNKSISGGQITSAVANATLAANVTTNANLTGDVTSVGNATTLTNAPVIAKVLTGYVSGAGTVAATDSILQAIQKVDGNDALRETSSKKDASGGYAGLTLLKLNLKNAANTITNFFTTAATVARTWTMPDKDGTVAMISDITGTNSGTNTGDQTNITGNAGTATALQTARTIGGTSFNGTANITISTVEAAAGTALLPSIAALGNLNTGVWFPAADTLAASTAGVERIRVTSAGNVGIGTATPNANAILDVSSTTKAFMPPRMTTTQKNAIASPTAGMLVYDSTLNKLSVYTTTWQTVTSI